MEFRAAKLTVVNPYRNIEFIVDFNGESYAIPPLSKKMLCFNVNLLADNQMLGIPVTVIPPADGMNSVTQTWTIQPQGSMSNKTWVIQVTGNQVYLLGS